MIADLGATTTLQDGGRRGSGRYGVPRSGPVDVLSHRLAARLAGVPVEDVDAATAIEVGPHPTTLGAVGGAVTLAVVGAGAQVRHEGVDVPAPCVVPLVPGSTCTVRARTWAYVVPAGALEVPAVLGSRSHHTRSGLGPQLSAGDRIAVGGAVDRPVGRWPSPIWPAGELRVLPAPQTPAFTAEARDRLVSSTYRTTTSFDRMGHRIAGPTLAARAGHDIISDGIVPGAIQVPGDGVPFVLTADHQTTGGYPKIAVLATADLARFVQLPPGAPVRFAWADVDAARRRLEQAVAAVERVAADRPQPLGSRLGGANLISGVSEDP